MDLISVAHPHLFGSSERIGAACLLRPNDPAAALNADLEVVRAVAADDSAGALVAEQRARRDLNVPWLADPEIPTKEQLGRVELAAILDKYIHLRGVHPILVRAVASYRVAEPHQSLDDFLARPLTAGGPPAAVDLLWQHRPDLQRAFPYPSASDYDPLLAWARTQGLLEAGLREEWLPTPPPVTEPPRGRTRRRRRRVRRVALVRVAGADKGLAIAASLLVDQLRAAGAQVDVREIVPGDWPHRIVVDAEDAVIFCFNADHLQRVARRTITSRRARRVAYWWWESTDVPAFWANASRWVDEVWAPTPFIHNVFEANLPRPVRRVPVPIPHLQPPPSATTAPFRVLVDLDANSSAWRKNPEGALAAWAEAFPVPEPERQVLCIKWRNGEARGLPELRPDQVVLHHTVDRSEQLRLVAGADAILSMHRGEGLGLTLAEALAMGRLVIATGWGGSEVLGGHPGFWRVQHRLVVTNDPTGTYASSATWAEPDIAHAASLIKLAAAATYGDRAAWRAAGLHHIATLRAEAAGYDWTI